MVAGADFVTQIEIDASDDVRKAIEAIGRTEDVHFSPSNRMLAVAGFRKNEILILDVNLAREVIKIPSALTLQSSDFSFPHGTFWLDENRLAVANRGGAVAIVAVPDRANERRASVSALLTLKSDHLDLLSVPGSVSAHRLGRHLIELMVCNNASHTVTRHLLHDQGGVAVLSSEIVAREGLSIPDGVTYDSSRTWVAVSNHNDHSVYVYRVEDLGKLDRPSAVLRGMSYPHGLRFSADARLLFVADAGAPYIHVFSPGEKGWNGALAPVDSIRAVDEETFLRGRDNEQEGGPKGVDVGANGSILVASCHQQPLAFFWIGGLTNGPGAAPQQQMPNAATEPDITLLSLLEANRAELGRLRALLAETVSREAGVQSELSDAKGRIVALQESSSWKMSAPLRWLARKLRSQ